MNMFARFDENPAMTLQLLKKQNVTDGRTDGQTEATDNVKTVYPTTNKVCGGYNKAMHAYCIIVPEKSLLLTGPG